MSKVPLLLVPFTQIPKMSEKRTVSEVQGKAYLMQQYDPHLSVYPD